MMTVLHVLIEAFCVLIVLAGAVFLCAAFGSWRVNDAVERALADDRWRVEQAYRSGGWDTPVTDTPIYDATVAAQVDLALWELARDLDAFEDGQR